MKVNKVIVSMITIIVIILGIIAAIFLMKPYTKNNKNIVEIGQTQTSENSITIENNNQIKNSVKQTNTSEEKISPKAFVTYKIKYEKCGHEISQYREIPEELVNLTQEELKEKYSEWNIEDFSDTNIVLSKTEKGSCNEHFILKEKDGFATVFKKLENGEEEEYEKTDIATEYLSDTDKLELKKGIEVNGLQNLNQLIEDYE